MRVAYQGERGAFSEAAGRRLLGTDITAVPCPSFEEMFDSVQRGDADCCVAPIENSLAGSIHRNYDLLLESGLSIAAETNLRIVHNLIAHQDADLAKIRRVYSHPVALAQCMKYLRARPDIEAIPVHDTAGGVRQVLERGNRDEAGIASADAAEIYGGRIVASGIEDNTQNYTRFLLLAAGNHLFSLREVPRRWKTSLMFRMPNKPGALFRALGAFAIVEVDLTRIESRPVEGRPWEYSFYVDVVGRADEPTVARALASLTDMAEMVKILGSYPTRW